MAYTAPTATQIQARWPNAFSAVATDTIDIWIATATSQIDTSWIETDYTYAIELLTAHLMVGNGIGAGAEAEMAAQGMSGFSTIRSGQLTLSRGTTSRSDADGVPSPWNTSWYGIQFYWLARKNKPAMTVAQAPEVWPNGYVVQ